MYFFKSGTFLGLRAYSLYSRSTLRTVSTLMFGQILSRISVAGIKGFLVLSFLIIRLVVFDTTDFLPLVSSFGLYFNAFLIIFAEQPNQLCTSLYVFPSNINFFYQFTCFIGAVLCATHFFKKKKNYHSKIIHIIKKHCNLKILLLLLL